MKYKIDIEKLKQQKKAIIEKRVTTRNNIEEKLYKYIKEEYDRKGRINAYGFENYFLGDSSKAILMIEVPLYDMYEYGVIQPNKENIVKEIIGDESLNQRYCHMC